MRITLLFLLTASEAMFGYSPLQLTQSGEDVMRLVNKRYRGGDCRMQLHLVLRDSQGREHAREIRMARKSLATGYRSDYLITAPAHLGGIRLLLGEDAALNSMWMFFPSGNQLVRVATRGLSALASDFSCEDLRMAFPLQDYYFKNLGVGSFEGNLCVRVEMRPRTDRLRRELGFARAIGWVRQDAWIVVRAEYFDDQDKIFKVFDGSSLQMVQGVWTLMSYSMVNYRAQHKSDVHVEKVEYRLGLPLTSFDPNRLRRINSTLQ